MRRSACSGKAWGDGTATAISGDRSLKTSRCGRVGASERSGLARGDVTGGGGVCRLHGEARGAWWAWWQRTTAAALCSGEERRGRGEGEQRVRERREGHQGGSWHRGGVRGRLGNASVEAGGGHGERARDSEQPASSSKRRETTRSQVGWVSELGRTGFARLGCYSGGLCR